MTLKISILFQQSTALNRVGGWSETWYREGSVDDSYAAASLVCQDRSGFLTTAASMVGIRIQTIGGGSKAFPKNLPGQIGTDQDIPQMALQCSIDGLGVPNRKYFQLRGLPDSNVINGDFRATRLFTTAFQLFAAQLQTQAFRFRAKPAGNAIVKIIDIDLNGNYTLSLPTGAVAGSYLQLLAVRNVGGANVSGTYFVESVATATTGKLKNWVGGVVMEKGKARLSTVFYPLCDGSTLERYRATTRKVGRPFGLYLGRRTSR